MRDTEEEETEVKEAVEGEEDEEVEGEEEATEGEAELNRERA